MATRGRPTKYSEDILVKTKEYIDSCSYELYPLTKSSNATGETVEYRTRVNLPMIAGLALHLGVTRETCYKWQSEHVDFSDICDELMAKQEMMLANGGASGDLTSSIPKMMMAKHGYSDRQELTGKDGEPLTVLFDESFKNKKDD